MKLVKTDKQQYPLTPNGIYQAEVTYVGEANGERTDAKGVKKPWYAVRFKFKIIADMYGSVCESAGNILQGQVYAGGKEGDSMTINPGTDLDKWLVVLGINVQKGEPLETDALIGRKCAIEVEIDDDNKYSNVVKILVLPPKSAPASTQQAPVSAPVPVATAPTAPAVASPPAVNNKDVFNTPKPKGGIPF